MINSLKFLSCIPDTRRALDIESPADKMERSIRKAMGIPVKFIQIDESDFGGSYEQAKRLIESCKERYPNMFDNKKYVTL